MKKEENRNLKNPYFFFIFSFYFLFLFFLGAERLAEEVKSWDVHRMVLVGGTRPADFFSGAAREGVTYTSC